MVDVSPDVNSYDVIMGKDKKKKGKGKEKTADKTEKKLKSKVLKKTGEVSYMNSRYDQYGREGKYH